jgi:hypothetical protein
MDGMIDHGYLEKAATGEMKEKDARLMRSCALAAFGFGVIDFQGLKREEEMSDMFPFFDVQRKRRRKIADGGKREKRRVPSSLTLTNSR